MLKAFVACYDTVMFLSTGGTQCAETWLGETTTGSIVLNSNICLQMTELVNSTIALDRIRSTEEGLKSINIGQDFERTKIRTYVMEVTCAKFREVMQNF